MKVPSSHCGAQLWIARPLSAGGAAESYRAGATKASRGPVAAAAGSGGSDVPATDNPTRCSPRCAVDHGTPARGVNAVSNGDPEA